jgi:ATP-dependent exoDNAse (exonuclease V) beta subunit
VSVTRAKDRLYLAAEVDEKTGRLRRGARSLASLLPASLGNVFALAVAATSEDVEWVSQSGTFAARVCRPLAAEPAVSLRSEPPPGAIDLRPLTSRQPAVAAAGGEDEGASDLPSIRSVFRSDGDQRLVGTLVHRLFQLRVAIESRTGPGNLATVAALVPRLIRAGEAVDVADLEALASQTASTFLRLSLRSDVRELLASGMCYYEVPFSVLDSPQQTILRGRIDCVVDRGDRLSILEFKTGGARPEHQVQASVYVAALQSVFPRREIDAHVIYP